MSIDPRLRTALSCLALVAAVFAVFAEVRSHDFLAYDSGIYITNNARVLSGLSWDNVHWAFTNLWDRERQPVWGANWHPITWLSHMLDVQIFGLRASAHNLENVAWHAANSVLVFLFLQRTTAAWGKSLFVAALFALHPLHVEPVVWIVERKELLSTFFGLCSLLFYASYARRGSLAAYAAALACMALGLMSKPMIVTWPFVMLLADYWPLERAELPGIVSRKLVREKLPFLALTLVFSLSTILAQSSGGAMQSLGQHPLGSRVLNALGSYAMYVGKLLWPSDLAPHYPLRPSGPPMVQVIAGAALLVVVSMLALRAMRRKKYLVGWFYFVGTLVPVIGLVQVGQQAWADRFSYLPSIGFFAAIVWGGDELFARSLGAQRARWIETSVAVAITAACAFFAHRQVATWKDTITVGRHMLEVTSDNNVAHNLLGMGLVDAGEVEEACDHFREALRLAPGDLDALDNYGAALTRLGRYAEAEVQFRQALAMNPTRPNLYQHLGQALQAQGKNTEALVYLNEAVRMHPEYWPAHTTRGQVLEQLGRNDDARASYERAIAIRPNYIPAWMSLARMLMRLNDYDAAAVALTRAVAVDPQNAEIHRGLARAYMARSRAREAAAELDLVLRLRPEWPVAEGDLAWLLATANDASVRDAKRAVILGEHAAQTSGIQQPTVLDALAAAYAADGRFTEAASTAEKAVARAKAMGDADLAAKIEKRLAAYRAGRIDRETPR